MVRSAAVAPLRAQGIAMGALAVADRRGGLLHHRRPLAAFDGGTNASVVLANSRLYEMVRRSEEEWETVFNALTEGIAVVGPSGAILRANQGAGPHWRGCPSRRLVGRNFCAMLSASPKRWPA